MWFVKSSGYTIEGQNLNHSADRFENRLGLEIAGNLNITLD